MVNHLTDGELKARVQRKIKPVDSITQMALDLICCDIDEAKKDFPYFIPEWFDHGVKKYGRKKFYKNDVKAWFKKWFGE